MRSFSYTHRSAALFMAVLSTTAWATAHAAPVPLNLPAESTIPAGPEGEAVKLGKLLVSDTRKQLPKNVAMVLIVPAAIVAMERSHTPVHL